jgi:SAM-dependent MidA family methyltransferase
MEPRADMTRRDELSGRGGDSNPALVDAIRGEIAASGRITFAHFMELALYHSEHGYYLAAERRPGRPGDFLTAPEASPYFGLTLARQIAECWERLGRPDPFVVREYGAGVGGLAYDIIAGLSTEAPECATVLNYRLIEPNPHRLAQALDAMEQVGLRHIVVAEDAEHLEPITGVVLANEVADAFPVHRLVMRDGRFRERYVVWRAGWFAEEEGERSEPAQRAAEMLAKEGVAVPDGAAVDVSPAAASWFASAGAEVRRGYAILIDYGYPARELYQAHRLEGTVRGYHEHSVTDDPFQRVGEQDLTAHVDFTALERAGESAGMRLAGFTTQGAFLASLGLGDLLVQLQHEPSTTLPDYLAAQAAVLRLIDPGGLGRFGVLIMAKNAPVEPPLRGFSVAAPGF